jgi:hypothetical protein
VTSSDVRTEIERVLRNEAVREAVLADRALMEMVERSIAEEAAGAKLTPLDELPRRQ